MGRKKSDASSLDKKQKEVAASSMASVITRKRAALCESGEDSKKQLKRSPQNAAPDPSTSAALDATDQFPKSDAQAGASSSDGNVSKPQRGRRRSRKDSGVPEDAVARIKRQVRYFFLRMDQERNLIDAYSNDGWKGQSREKVRPEKELIRADNEIRKCKLRVRDAMRELDGILLEGSIMDSAFDDDGQLDYQEIFCAVCHSHDAEIDNDIVLCDGACNRGFHQRCLTPPLETKDIPPGDEGWVCPACQCKEDCVELINDKLGTNYEIESGWETFFPDAVSGTEENDAAKEAASDESDDDDDYDPSSKGPESAALDNQGEADAAQDEAADSSESEEKSRGSESGASEEEDSDSEDLSDEDLDQFLKDSKQEELREQEGEEDEDQGRKEAENRSLDADDSDAAETVSGKRRRRDVDYRKLHDEMFGWVQDFEGDFQLSDDEDWGPMKRQRRASAAASARAAAAQDDAETPVPSDKSKRIPQEAVERLRGAFAENQLPSRPFKEDISKELGLSYRKVDVWFKNERCHALKKGLVKPTRPCPWKVKQQNLDNALLRRLGEVEFKLHDLRKTMDAVQQPQVLKFWPRLKSFENSFFDASRGKCVIYRPVVEVVERPAAADWLSL